MSERYSRGRVKGFLHTDGRVMRNGDGEEILLRGWCAGNWTNPEGFLCGDSAPRSRGGKPTDVPSRLERARGWEESVRLLCGSEYAASFWPRWYRAHLGEADIRAMAEYGYNSIRLPLNARAFLPEEPGYRWNENSFEMLDQVIDWCEQYKLYAILDLHTTPGGQSALHCDDGIDAVPRFYEEEESQERTIRLWEKLAERYRDRWIVGGYDLLNEPLAPASQFHLMPKLVAFYDRLIARIRQIDRRHMLTIEGAAASTNTEIFDHDYDPVGHNWCIHTHFYGLSPEERSLYRYLDKSLEWNVPIWMGEGGGNQVDVAVLAEVFRKHGIGLCLWSWKVATFPDGRLRRDPVQYRLPAGWDRVLACLHEGAPRPSYAECQRIFDEMLENMRFENCIQQPEQHTWLTQGVNRRLPGAAYDTCGEAPFHGHWPYGNPCDFRTEDRMHLRLRPGCEPPRRAMPFDSAAPAPYRALENLALQLDEGDWASYTVCNPGESCDCVLLAAAPCGAKLIVTSDGAEQALEIPPSEKAAAYPVATLSPAPSQTVRIACARGSAVLEELQWISSHT